MVNHPYALGVLDTLDTPYMAGQEGAPKGIVFFQHCPDRPYQVSHYL